MYVYVYIHIYIHKDPPLSPDAKFHTANMERLKTRPRLNLCIIMI